MTLETLEGRIVFQPINLGSKSEHIAPILYVKPKNEDLEAEQIHLVSDCDPSFNYTSIIPFDKKYVRTEGSRYRGKFIVNLLEEIDDPEQQKK